MAEERGILLRVLNNNAVMVDVGGSRRILLGRGIGFNQSLGAEMDPGDAHEQFVPTDAMELRQIADFAREIPLEEFDVARRAVTHAVETAGLVPSQTLLLSIVDHLHFSLVRATEGVELDMPLKWEIEQLYPEETALGRATVELARASLTPAIPADESTAFAMHFVNAQFATADTSRTATMTAALRRVVEIVTDVFGPEAAADGMSMSRFVTHLRYLFNRLATRRQIEEEAPELLAAVHAAYPQVEEAARRIRGVIETGGTRLSEAEVCYLTIHLGRIATTVRPEAP